MIKTTCMILLSRNDTKVSILAMLPHHNSVRRGLTANGIMDMDRYLVGIDILVWNFSRVPERTRAWSSNVKWQMQPHQDGSCLLIVLCYLLLLSSHVYKCDHNYHIRIFPYHIFHITLWFHFIALSITHNNKKFRNIIYIYIHFQVVRWYV